MNPFKKYIFGIEGETDTVKSYEETKKFHLWNNLMYQGNW